ncbi:hypothetical protein C0993_010444 [Termitomyces sp. T159_Od127]|nr:hypothetical protein C0993_010444 [Termitomyces sp. T159_Od127]
MEDNNPGDLAKFETCGDPPSIEELAALVSEDNAHTTPALASTPANPAPRSAEATPETPPAPPEPMSAPAIAAPKVSRWANLPPRDHPTCAHYQVKCYGVVAVDDETSKEEHNG